MDQLNFAAQLKRQKEAGKGPFEKCMQPLLTVGSFSACLGSKQCDWIGEDADKMDEKKSAFGVCVGVWVCVYERERERERVCV